MMMKKLYLLLTIMLCGVMPTMAQNTDDNHNKAVFQTNDGNSEVNTDDIQLIRFDGGKVTVVQPWGETVFDHTLQDLTFLRPQSGTLRLTVDANIDTSDNTNRAFSIDGSNRLVSTWEEGDIVYVYSDGTNTTPIGTLTPATTGSSSARLVGNINATGLADNQTLYLETQPRTYSFASQTGSLSNIFYVKATAEVSITGANATISDATFTRPMAVVKFTLQDKATAKAIKATPLVIKVGETTYTVTPTSAASEIYFAIPEFSDQNISLTATVGSDTYTYHKTGVTFANGRYYAIAVNMVRIPIAADIGKIIASDGRIYDVNAPLPELVNPVAMIAFIGNESDCTHGLAIALTDDTDASFSVAKTNSAGHIPTAAILGGTWRLPTKADWENMFLACKKDGDATSATADMKIAGFKEKISSAGTGFTDGHTYWTSTDSPSAFCIIFSDPDQVSFQNGQYKMNEYKVRAVLAF